MPLSHSWGAQVDMATANHDAGNISFVGGHLFWRQPETGLLGILGSKHSSTLGDTDELGFQAEKFFTNFTLRAELGYQSYNRSVLKLNNGLPLSPDAAKYSLGKLSEDEHFWALKGSWYLTDDIVAYAMAERNIGRNGDTSIGFEWQIGSADRAGYSIYSEVKDIDHHGKQALFGLRVYFDGKKNLKMRHRTADPAVSFDANGNPSCPSGYRLSGSGANFDYEESCVRSDPYGYGDGSLIDL